MEEKEIWKDVIGYEGLYKVSNKGNVFGVKRNKLLKINEFNKGYCEVRLCKDGIVRNFRVHRLVFVAFCGKIPPNKEIDHINRIRNDNRVENLRIVTHKENVNNPLTIKEMARIRIGEQNCNYGKHLSEETKNKISKSLSNSPRHPWRGKHFTKEHRDKISKAMLGKHLSEETKIKKSKPILQYTIDGHLLKEWLSATQIQSQLGYNKSNICNCCRGKINKVYGSVWKYKDN